MHARSLHKDLHNYYDVSPSRFTCFQCRCYDFKMTFSSIRGVCAERTISKMLYLHSSVASTQPSTYIEQSTKKFNLKFSVLCHVHCQLSASDLPAVSVICSSYLK